MPSSDIQHTTLYDLVGDKILEVRNDLGTRRLSLPDILELMGEGGDIEFTECRPHQRPALHMFLVQAAVAAILLDGGNPSDARATSETWRRRLLSMAGDDADVAWALIAPHDRPAFLQAPAPDIDDFPNTELCPDALTMLVLSKNHMVKQERIRATDDPALWAYALIELQTMSSFGGRSNYGVIRMNGGLGNRPLIAVYDSMRQCDRWLRDVARYTQLLIDNKDGICDTFSGNARSGMAMTWLPPWDGRSQLSMADLHPACIEICRRLRLERAGSNIVARVYNSTSSRIDAPSGLAGITGDPWTPLSDNGKKSLSVGPAGFSVDLLRQLVIPSRNSSIRPSPLQRLGEDDRRDMYLYGAALVGGQGKTGGFHEVTLPIPARVVDIFDSQEELDAAGRTASGMVADAEKAHSILRHAVAIMADNGRFGKASARALTVRFRESVKDVFFDHLWRRLDGLPRDAWIDILTEEANALFESSCQAAPTKSGRFYELLSSASRYLRVQLRKLRAGESVDVEDDDDTPEDTEE